MSDLPCELVAAMDERIRRFVADMGCKLPASFMTLSFQDPSFRLAVMVDGLNISKGLSCLSPFDERLLPRHRGAVHPGSMMDKMESFRSKVVTWDEISRWTLDVARQIQDCRCKPTVIIGLTRGGWIPARLLCDHLHVKKLYAVKTEHWGVTANQDGKALLTQELNANIQGEQVLIVDDITDTGESLKLAISHVKELDPKAIQTACLLHITHSKIEPDFYSVRVDDRDWTWFIFPWNLHEDLRTILPKTLYEGKTEEEIRKAFKEQFQVDVSEDLVRSTLKDLEAMSMVNRIGRIWRKTI